MSDRIIPLVDARRAIPLPDVGPLAPGARVADTLRPAAARPAHLGHRPLQLPLHLLHAEGRLRPGLQVPAAQRVAATFEEITRLARLFKEHGIEKIRLTGGEPLLRRDLERLIEMLANLGGLDLTLTTNGSLLARKARALRDAGLNRLTVSLDSLDDAVFRAMNDVDFPVAAVLEGIDAATARASRRSRSTWWSSAA